MTPLNAPKQQFFKYGPTAQFVPSKSNWFEGEEFTGMLTLQIDSGLPPVRVDILIEGFESIHWTEQ